MNIKTQMKDIKSLLQEFSPSRQRRELLNSEMGQLNSSGKDCFSCSGMCCSYEFNSMKISPIEAWDILEYLIGKDVNLDELKENLTTNIKHFRLDKEFPGLGAKSLRRYYTCPFYKGSSSGCTISKHSKPYGCLAFNPIQSNVSEANKCKSNIATLETRAKKYEMAEEKMNALLKEKLKIDWETKDISSSVLYMVNHLSTHSN